MADTATQSYRPIGKREKQKCNAGASMTTENAEESFANHPVRTLLRATIGQTREAAHKHGPALDELGRSRLTRGLRNLEFAAEIVERSDPELVAVIGALDALKPHLDAIAAALPAISAANPGAVKPVL